MNISLFFWRCRIGMRDTRAKRFPLPAQETKQEEAQVQRKVFLEAFSPSLARAAVLLLVPKSMWPKSGKIRAIISARDANLSSTLGGICLSNTRNFAICRRGKIGPFCCQRWDRHGIIRSAFDQDKTSSDVNRAQCAT